MSIVAFVRRHVWATAGCLAVVVVAACVNVGMAFVVQGLVSGLTSGELVAHPETAWSAVAYLVPWALSDYAWAVLTFRLIALYHVELRRDLSLPVREAQVPYTVGMTKDSSAFAAAVTVDVETLGADYALAFFRGFYDIVVFVATVVATGLIDPAFVPFVVVLSLVSAAMPWLAKKKLAVTQEAYSAERASLLNEASHIADGMESITSCRCASRVWQAYDKAVANVSRAFARRLVVREAVITISIASGKLITYGIWGLGALAVAQGSIDLAKLVALAQLMTVLQEPVQEISTIYSTVIAGRAIVSKLEGLVARKPAADEGAATGLAAAAAPAPADGLACEGLTVAAEGGGEVLSGARLAVPAGARVLVEGPSGAGKTTLLRALAGTAAASGAVWLGGEPLGPAEDRAGRVCLVTQAAFRAAPDLAGCMDPGGSGDALAAARGAASAWPGVLGPLAARLAEDPSAPASSLSGGEARRLHLLRGLLAAPEALLLDEACAGLDPASAAAALSEANASAAPVVLSVVHDLPADPASLGFTHRVRVEGGRVGPLEPL